MRVSVGVPFFGGRFKGILYLGGKRGTIYFGKCPKCESADERNKQSQANARS